MNYPHETKVRAVECYHSIVARFDNKQKACRAIADVLGVCWETVYKWTRGIGL
jgi:transposase-like protein